MKLVMFISSSCHKLVHRCFPKKTVVEFDAYIIIIIIIYIYIIPQALESYKIPAVPCKLGLPHTHSQLADLPETMA